MEHCYNQYVQQASVQQEATQAGIVFIREELVYFWAITIAFNVLCKL